MDVVLCFPPLLLALLVVTLLGPGATTLIPVLALVYLPGFVRVVYAGVLSVRSQDYVEAMRVLGAGRTPHHAAHDPAEYRRPGAGAVQPGRRLGRGAGIRAVVPGPGRGAAGAVLGADDRRARATMDQAPLLLLWPCAALTLTILAMNALCDALREALDPHQAVGGGLRRRLLGAAGSRAGARRAGPVLEVRGLTRGDRDAAAGRSARCGTCRCG